MTPSEENEVVSTKVKGKKRIRVTFSKEKLTPTSRDKRRDIMKREAISLLQAPRTTAGQQTPSGESLVDGQRPLTNRRK